MMHNLIVGCGDTGVRVAARAVAAGERVTGTVRTPTSARRVRAVGAQALVCDLDADGAQLPACDRLFYFAPPPRQGDNDTRVQRVIDALGRAPEHIVYVSTTGVYGDCGDDWVDEGYPVAPGTDRAKRRLDAERQLCAWSPRSVILRTPGIYGPGRLPIQRIRDAVPILHAADSGWTNRIHIDDLAAIAWQAGSSHWPHTVYHACDGNPTRMNAYYDALAALLDLPPPPRVDWATAQREFSAMRLSFLRESRRLSNARLRNDFCYRFAFADFRDGIAASLPAENR